MPLRIEQKIDLPHEPGEWIAVVQPGIVTLRRATEAKARDQIKWMTEAKELVEIQSKQAAAEPPPPADAAPAEPVKVDPFDKMYDLLTLLQGCIVGWSYPEPVTDEHVGWLSDKTARYVGERLLPRDDEADQKND